MARRTKEEAQQTRQQIIDAARGVFHQHGVARATLEQVAKAAGLTRGAVYWHFKNKAELFFAIREDILDPLIGRVDAILLSDDYANPLDAIEAAIKTLFQTLDEEPVLRQVMEIMAVRCEQVDEFADVQTEADRPAVEFLDKVGRVYMKAADRGELRSGLSPEALALDTWAFVSGLLKILLTQGFSRQLKAQVAAMVTSHIALRRP